MLFSKRRCGLITPDAAIFARTRGLLRALTSILHLRGITVGISIVLEAATTIAIESKAVLRATRSMAESTGI